MAKKNFRKTGKVAHGGKMGARVLGVNDVNRELNKRGIAGNTAMGIAIPAIAEIIKAAAKDKAPQDSGELSDHIIAETSGSGEKTVSKVGPDTGVFWGSFQEYGTSSSGRFEPKKGKKALQTDTNRFVAHSTHRAGSSKPFLRPAFDENIDSALDEVAKTLRDKMGL